MTPPDPTKWVDLYTDYLYSYAFFKTGNREEAEDLVQDTFLSAFKNLDGFKGNSTEKTWLTSILKNKIIDYYRKKKAGLSLDEYLDSTTGTFNKEYFHGEENHWNADIGPNFISESPDAYLLSKEFQKFLEICLMYLPMKIRGVFTAKYLDEEKPEAICKEYQITPSNYWVLLFRAKVMLRDCLEKKGVLS
jgi:RNA polymerase sigma-70 factor (ECF subfamily)